MSVDQQHQRHPGSWYKHRTSVPSALKLQNQNPGVRPKSVCSKELPG